MMLAGRQRTATRVRRSSTLASSSVLLASLLLLAPAGRAAAAPSSASSLPLPAAAKASSPSAAASTAGLALFDRRELPGPAETSKLTTEELRRSFLVDTVFVDGALALTAGGAAMDRLIVGGASPAPGAPLSLQRAAGADVTGKATTAFLARRELAAFNVGPGSAKVTVFAAPANGVNGASANETFVLAPREALYVAAGAPDVVFARADAGAPARVFLASAPCAVSCTASLFLFAALFDREKRERLLCGCGALETAHSLDTKTPPSRNDHDHNLITATTTMTTTTTNKTVALRHEEDIPRRRAAAPARRRERRQRAHALLVRDAGARAVVPADARRDAAQQRLGARIFFGLRRARRRGACLCPAK